MTELLLARFPRATTIDRMQSYAAALLLPVLLLGLGGCSYDPPVQGDHTSSTYRADLKTCRASSNEAVRLRNAKTLASWVISPVTGPPAVRAAIRTCLAGKGYAPRNPGG